MKKIAEWARILFGLSMAAPRGSWITATDSFRRNPQEQAPFGNRM